MWIWLFIVVHIIYSFYIYLSKNMTATTVIGVMNITNIILSYT